MRAWRRRAAGDRAIPAAREAGPTHGEVVEVRGSIPACAGNRCAPNSMLRGHPRLCGEADPAQDLHADTVGVIPASAGSSARSPPSSRWSRGHPRVRGGAVTVLYIRDRRLGSIPAGAGSSSVARRGPRRWRGHPCMRGEQGDVQSITWRQMGSSPAHTGEQAGSRSWWVSFSASCPRARGAGHVNDLHGRLVGSIPAGAGSSASGFGRASRCGVIPACAGSSVSHETPRQRAGGHPRVRGEQMSAWSSSPTPLGPSPPRVRGAGLRVPPAHPGAGAIPAGAGSRLRCRPLRLPSWVHPRERGEQLVGLPPLHFRTGPSPRVRGGEQRSFGTVSTASAGPSPRVLGADAAQRHPLPASGNIPRIRGAAPGAAQDGGGLGNVPAGAGSKGRRAHGPGRPRVHPHGHEEQRPDFRTSSASSGPSLRAPGAADPFREPRSRLPIPAYAGNRRCCSPTACYPSHAFRQQDSPLNVIDFVLGTCSPVLDSPNCCLDTVTQNLRAPGHRRSPLKEAESVPELARVSLPSSSQ